MKTAKNIFGWVIVAVMFVSAAFGLLDAVYISVIEVQSGGLANALNFNLWWMAIVIVVVAILVTSNPVTEEYAVIAGIVTFVVALIYTVFEIWKDWSIVSFLHFWAIIAVVAFVILTVMAIAENLREADEY